jgi:hypothetical protein
VVAARGKGQQRLGQRVHGLGEQQGAQLFRKRRAAGLARAHHLAPLRAQGLRERLEVRGLARTVYAFEADEQAGTCHGSPCRGRRG